MKAPAIVDDTARVAALHRLGVVGQPDAPDLDGITRLARYVCGADLGIINLIDADVQWQASVAGGVRGVFPREDTLCQHTVAENRLIHVDDASSDARFRDTPFVNGEVADIRMYCGVPLHDRAGQPVGSLCVTDSSVRSLDEAQVTALRDLAAQVEQLFELRRQHAELVDVLAEVDHFARHDPLTGLANRRVLVDRLDHALVRAERTGLPPTVFFCDLDGFKAVNDTYGHEIGDAVLNHAAQQLRTSVRPADTVCRLGGDEFVLLCEDLAREHVPEVLERIRAALLEPARVGDLMLAVSASIGTAVAAPAQDTTSLLRCADQQMYAEKVLRRTAGVREAVA